MAKASSTVLYVEDEESDRLLMRIAFAREGLEGVLQSVKDGQAALDYLSGTGVYAERENHPLPGVVLLDLNLPEVHGFDVLKWIRMHPLHSQLPVVIFSSSVHGEDQARARLLGANEFVTKPSSPGLFQEVARQLHGRWLNVTVAEKRSLPSPGS